LNERQRPWMYFVGDTQYMVGDTITFEIDLYHQANLTSVTAVFDHESDEEVAIYLEGTLHEDNNWQEKGKKSLAELTADVTLQHRPGEYMLDHFIIETAGGRVVQIPAPEEFLGEEDYSLVGIQIVEEPSGVRITGRGY
jgi:hypothetical protein